MVRALAAVAALALLYLGFGWARHAFRSDEELIRARLDEMVDGVNDSLPGKALSGFDRERYVDVPSGFGVEDLRSALLILFLREHVDLEAAFDPTDGLTLELQLDADPPRASVRFHCPIEEVRRDGTRVPFWDLSGVGELEKRDGEWRFVKSREVDHGSRRRL